MKALKFIASLMLSIAMSLFIGVAAAAVLPVNPIAVGAGVFAAKTIYFISVDWTIKDLALAGVNKEIWIEKLKEKFFSDGSWLEGVDDWSEWVENNTINFADMGANPVILKNNASWPIVAAQRTDTALTVVLDTYDSTTTRVRNVEEIESSYNKLQSVIDQHKKFMLQEIRTEALWNYAPATAAAGAVAVTGANRAAVIGSQSTVAATMILDDLAALQERWDTIEFPKEGRTVVLCPQHVRDLIKQDASLQKEFMNQKQGTPMSLYGFDITTVGNTPLYTKTTLAKKTYGAAADNTNDCVASVAFNKKEVMKCLGDMEMFYQEKGTNPAQRADEVGFQARAKVLPQRTTNFYQQALVSNRA